MKELIAYARLLRGQSKHFDFIYESTKEACSTGRWPIFRFFSREHFLGGPSDYGYLRDIDPATFDIIDEHPILLRSAGFSGEVSSLLMVSTSMGSRVVLSSEPRDSVISLDFHGKTEVFPGFAAFAAAEFRQEIFSMEAQGALVDFVRNNVKTYDYRSLDKMPFA